MSEELKQAREFLQKRHAGLVGCDDASLADILSEFASQVCEQRDSEKLVAALGDSMTDLAEQGQDLNLAEYWQKRAEAAELALQTLQNAKYMLCVRCGNEISRKDWDAIPLQQRDIRCPGCHGQVGQWRKVEEIRLQEELIKRGNETAELRNALQAKEQELGQAKELLDAVRYQESKLKELFALCQASDPESSIAQLHEHFAGDKRVSDTVTNLRHELAQLGVECPTCNHLMRFHCGVDDTHGCLECAYKFRLAQARQQAIAECTKKEQGQ